MSEVTGNRADRIRRSVVAILVGTQTREAWRALLRRSPDLARFEALLDSPPWSMPTSHELATLVGLEERTFRNRVRRLVGLTPTEIVTSLKIARAAQELQRDGATVKGVAHREGFASPSGLVHHFLRYLGHPPSAVRRGAKPVAGMGPTERT